MQTNRTSTPTRSHSLHPERRISINLSPVPGRRVTRLQSARSQIERSLIIEGDKIDSAPLPENDVDQTNAPSCSPSQEDAVAVTESKNIREISSSRTNKRAATASFNSNGYAFDDILEVDATHGKSSTNPQSPAVQIYSRAGKRTAKNDQ